MDPLEFCIQSDWPPLAWVAQCCKRTGHVRVQHGRGVELLEDSYCEAVWNGKFPDGGLDQTDIVFGSGGRLVADSVMFVSASNTVDRLQWHEGENNYTISNSLAGLMAAVGGEVSPGWEGGFGFFETIIYGFDQYKKELQTSVGCIHLTYFRNVVWDGNSIREVDKKIPQRAFREFADYYGFLTETLTALGDNLTDKARQYPLTPLASISTGYDSPTVAAMARFSGLKETISIARGRGNVDDDGSEISRQLGLKPLVAKREEVMESTALLPLFIASDGKGEDLYFSACANTLENRALFTGYGGSRLWESKDRQCAQFKRGDQSGLSHTEARLHIGYIHCPIAFLGGTQETEIRAIGRTSEMQPWRIGSDYDRPISRRILEEAGVPRGLFGVEKKASSVLLFDRRTFLPPGLREDFDEWMSQHKIQTRTTIQDIAGRLLRCLHQMNPTETWPLMRRLSSEGRLQKLAYKEPRFRYLFPWALHKAAQRYIQ